MNKAKAQKNIRSGYINIYYRLTPKLFRNWWLLWWSGITVCGLVLTLILVSLFNEPFPVTGIFAFWGLCLFFPIVNFVVEKMYLKIESDLVGIYVAPKEFLEWFRQTYKKIFAIKGNRALWLSTLAVSFACIGVVLLIGIPFQTPLLKLLSFVCFSVPVFCAGQAAYLIVAALYILWRMTDFDLKPLYYPSVEASPFAALYNVYYVFSLLIIFGYAMTVLLVWQSPIGFVPLFTVFLVIDSMFPLMLLISSTMLIRRIQKHLQQNLLKRINDQLEQALLQLEQIRTQEAVNYVNGLLEVQAKVKSARNLPFNIEGFFVFIVSFAIPVVQFVLSLR